VSAAATAEFDPAQTLDGPAAHPNNGHSMMTAVGRFALMSGVVDLSPQYIRRST
jgi:hypothetical protein